MSSTRLAPLITSVTSPTRLDVSSTCLGASQKSPHYFATAPHEEDRRRDACLASVGRFWQRWRRPIRATWYYAFRRDAVPSLSPRMILSTERGRRDPEMARVDWRRHRPQSWGDRRSSHLARPRSRGGGSRQGANRRPQALAGRRLDARGSLWNCHDVMAAGDGVETILSIRTTTVANPARRPAPIVGRRRTPKHSRRPY